MPKYTLMQHQTDGVKFLDDHDGIAALLFDPGVGKQQPVSEPVLTPDGWRRIGDIKPCDYVIAMDGTPTKVESIHPQADRRVYKVVMNDGSWTYAGPDHLWLARTHNHANRGVDYAPVTTEQMRANPSARWEIPMTTAVEFPETDSIDPYLAGVIAGDGCKKSGGRTIELCTDTEIINSLGLAVNRPHETSTYTSYAYVPVDMHKHLFRGQRSWEKTLPEAIVYGSVEQRYAALQGLLDTDGSPIQTGGVEFTTTSPALAEQAQWLAESLGGSVRVGATRKAKYTHNGETRLGRESYRLNIKMPEGFPPFRLLRKASRWTAPTKYPVKRCVKSIEFSHEEESVCIKVEHPTHTYLTRSCIVTHNTGTTLSWVDRKVPTMPSREFRVLVVAPLTAADTWVLQAPPFMDSMVKARFLQGTTKDILKQIEQSRTWTGVPDTHVMANHKGTRTSQVSGNRVTILSMSSGAISSWCRDDPIRKDKNGRTIGSGRTTRTAQVQLLRSVRKYSPHLIVVDESHQIKTHNSNVSKALYQIGQLAPHRIILTGTVSPHSPLDVYGQWRFLAPWTFSQQYTEAYTKTPLTMTVAQRKEIRPWSWGTFRDRYAQMGGFGGKNVVGMNDVTVKELHDRVAERSMVVLKEDALDLPPVQDVDIHVSLTPREMKAYEDMARDLAAQMDSGELLKAPNPLAKMMKLRQITAGFVKDTETGIVHVVGDSKQKAIAEVNNVTLLGENRLVIFAYFRAECEALAAKMRMKGRTVEVITGATPARERLAIRQRFADVSGNPQQTVLIAQARTMSLSVNELVVAQNGTFGSLSERRDDWVQARGRLDRNGQQGSHVTFWNVYVPGTVDEVMLNNHGRKGDLEKAMLDHIKQYR